MNDFEQGIADDEVQQAFAGGFVPPTETAPTDAVPKKEGPPLATKQEPIADAAAGNVTEYGGGEKTGSSVYIANMQWWTTDADVERLCSTYGPVVNINFLAERSNGKSKGVALVEFADSQAAARCKEGLSGGFGGGGRYGYGHYDRGRMPEGRGRGRHGRGYGGHGGYDARPGMGMHMMGEIPGYMHEMGMMDMPPEVMPPMEGHMGQHGPGYVPPPPYPMPGAGGYMHDEAYEQNPYYRRGGERWDHGMGQDDLSQKRQRPTS